MNKMETALNSWIRQQGTFLLPNRTFRKNLKLQFNRKNPINENSTHLPKLIENSRLKESKFETNFHLKCIEDVRRYNSPNDSKLKEPNDSKYDYNLPYVKYSTFLNKKYEAVNLKIKLKCDFQKREIKRQYPNRL